ncbi:MAG: type II toxin-antitoxin system VapC family toxin [Nitrospirae bacterium]|nr:type II toxin-antitoxin system VapC family toxin [Nitrospirota bacterium]
MRKVLLDTSAYSMLMRGSNKVADLLDAAEDVYLPVVVIGELLAGFKKGSAEQRNIAILGRFFETPSVNALLLDEDTASFYATIADYLRRQGTPIPTNDLWIAACAMQHGLALITTDRHFLHIPQVVTTFIEVARSPN